MPVERQGGSTCEAGPALRAADGSALDPNDPRLDPANYVVAVAIEFDPATGANCARVGRRFVLGGASSPQVADGADHGQPDRPRPLSVVPGSVPVPAQLSPGAVALFLWREQVKLPPPAPRIAPGWGIVGKEAYLEIGGARDPVAVDLHRPRLHHHHHAPSSRYEVDWGDGTLDDAASPARAGRGRRARSRTRTRSTARTALPCASDGRPRGAPPTASRARSTTGCRPSAPSTSPCGSCRPSATADRTCSLVRSTTATVQHDEAQGRGDPDHRRPGWGGEGRARHRAPRSATPGCGSAAVGPPEIPGPANRTTGTTSSTGRRSRRGSSEEGFLEWEEFLGALYGTPTLEPPAGPRRPARDRARGRPAGQAASIPTRSSLFVVPPSRAVQEERLRRAGRRARAHPRPAAQGRGARRQGPGHGGSRGRERRPRPGRRGGGCYPR